MNPSDSLTPDQYLQLEAVCDQYELELRHGQAKPIEYYLRKVPPTLQDRLRADLADVEQDFCRPAESTDISDPHLHNSAEALTGRVPFNTANVQMAARERSANRSSSTQGAATTKANTLPEKLTVGLSSALAAQQKANFESNGRFQLNSILGQGGAGTVWKAFDLELQRAVAVKLPNPSTVSDASRFVREVKATAALTHPNIVTLYDAGMINGQCFMVNELVEGQSLAELTRHQPLPISQAVSIIRAVVSAIEHSHAVGIIHRDLKPHNVLVSRDGQPRVTDFGLAKLVGLENSLTGDGDLIGTPSYMAPEQATGGGRRSDERTDIYGIGSILFHLLTGRAPFRGSFERVIFQVIHAPTPSVRELNPEVPAPLAAICEKCLEKDPQLRFQSASELGCELDRYAHGVPIQTKPVGWWGRYRRWLRRDPKLAATTSIATALLMAIAVGASVAAWQLNAIKQQLVQAAERAISANADAQLARQQESAARQLAEHQAMLAGQRANEARQTADFLASFLEPADLLGINRTIDSPVDAKAMTPEMLEQANDNAEMLLADQPVTLARIKGVIGNVFRGRGNLGRARTLLDEASEILNGAMDQQGEPHLADNAMLEMYHAVLDHCEGHIDKAQTRLTRSVQLHRTAIETNGSTVLGQLQLAQAEFSLGSLLLRQRKNEQARPHLKAALEIRRQQLPADDSLRLATELVWCQCESDDGDLLALLPQAIRTVAAANRLSNERETTTATQILFLYSQVFFARTTDHPQAAVAPYEQLMTLLEQRVGRRSPTFLLAAGDLAGLYWEIGNYRLATPWIEFAIDRAQEIAPEHPQLCSARLRYGEELYLAGRFSEAEQQYQAAIDSGQLRFEADALGGLACCLIEQAKFQEAMAITHRVVENEKVMAVQAAWFSFNHAITLQNLNQTDQADEFFRRALKLAEEVQPENSASWLERTGRILEYHDRLPQAEQRFRQALQVAIQRWGDQHPRAALQMDNLARVLSRQQRLDEAKEWQAKAAAIYEACLSENDIRRQSRSPQELTGRSGR